jgi:hypothetical protein
MQREIEPRFVRAACGKRGADVRPHFHWNKPPVTAMGYRKEHTHHDEKRDRPVGTRTPNRYPGR